MPPQDATISLNPGPAPALGVEVTFSYTLPSNLHLPPIGEPGSASIRIDAYRPSDGGHIFATAGYADRSFLLGGASSPWLTEGGPAQCVATLYYLKNNKVNDLASVAFEAAG